MTRRDPPDARKIDRTLDLVVRALVCAHPELADPERPYWLRQASRRVTAAGTLVDQTANMKQALIVYRAAIEVRRRDNAPEHPDDLRF